MANIFDTLRNSALTIKNELIVGANTAPRVGQMFLDIIAQLEAIGASLEVKTLTAYANLQSAQTALYQSGAEVIQLPNTTAVVISVICTSGTANAAQFALTTKGLYYRASATLAIESEAWHPVTKEEEMPTIYLNRYSQTSLANNDFRYKNTTQRGWQVVIPVKDGNGNLFELSQFMGKVHFWLQQVRDAAGTVITDLNQIQNYTLCLQYLLNGKENLSVICISTAYGRRVNAQVKDLYGKANEIYIEGAITHACLALGASVEAPLVGVNVEQESIVLDDENTDYTVSAATGDNILVLASIAGCSVIFPALNANKTFNLLVSADSQPLLINGVSTEPETTLFCFYDANTNEWDIRTTSQPEVPDYSDVSAKYGYNLVKPTIVGASMLNIAGAAKSDMVVLFKDFTQNNITVAAGLYFVAYKDNNGYSHLQKMADITAMRFVRIATGTDAGAWFSEYNGTDLATCVFERLRDKAVEVQTDDKTLIDSYAYGSLNLVFRLAESDIYEPLNSSLFWVKRVSCDSSWEDFTAMQEATGLTTEGKFFKKYRKLTSAAGVSTWSAWSNEQAILDLQQAIGDINTALDIINGEVI